jgi:signal transduction histidine kinase/ActR/RegA family two-component response regulator
MQAYLAMSVAALAIPVALIFCLLVYNLYGQDRAAHERQLFGAARIMMTAVDADLGQGWMLLNALAESDSLQRGDWRAFDAEARRATPPGMGVALTTPAGHILIYTRQPYGAQPSDVASEVFATGWRNLQTRSEMVSDVMDSPVMHRPVVFLSRLAHDGAGRSYLLSLSMEPAVLDRLLADQHLPAGWVAGLLDSRGSHIARSPARSDAAGQPSPPDLRRRIESGEEGVVSGSTRDGPPMVAAYARSSRSHWTGIVAVPKTELEGFWSAGLVTALGMSAAIFAVGAVLAGLLLRQLAQAMAALTAQAEAVGEGRGGPAIRTGLLEADRAAEALARAAAERAARETELENLNATLEARVTEATERLAQAHKMEALGQLTGGFAHDFNNLLSAVLGNIYLLKRSTLDGRQQRWLSNAEAAGERGAQLTSQLLSFSRRQRLTPEPLDLNAEVERVIDLLPSTLGDGVRLSVSLSKTPVIAMADRTQLELAVLNLAINARDAMPSGGLLSITVGETEAEASTGGQAAPPPGRYAVIAVADTGQGMDKRTQDRAFEPFFTTKGPGRGSGLGLPQVLGMARQLGGGVEIESEPGRGALVRLLLPLTDAAPVLPVEPLTAAPKASLELKILLVDDDEAVRTTTEGMLAALDCEVVAATSGMDAISRLADDFDVVVADYAMPGMNGAELAAAIAKRKPDLPVLIITGYADPQNLSNDWRGPVLAKPFDLETLEEAVRAAAHAAIETPADEPQMKLG